MILRTRIRGRLPTPLATLIPKKQTPCKYHDWYQSTPDTLACYDCTTTREGEIQACVYCGAGSNVRCCEFGRDI
jgi:hypothetical protein